MHKKVEHIIRRILEILECIIAILTLVVLIGMLGLEIYRMCTVSGYFTGIDGFLKNILTLVVGLEFVRMLVDMTPGNTLEVLVVAISRQIIVSHGNPWVNVACVACIAGLFATRRFLIPKSEIALEMNDMAHISKE